MKTSLMFFEYLREKVRDSDLQLRDFDGQIFFVCYTEGGDIFANEMCAIVIVPNDTKVVRFNLGEMTTSDADRIIAELEAAAK